MQVWSLGIMADSHGVMSSLTRALERMGPVDYLCHLGDHAVDGQRLGRELNREVVVVRGNCDSDREVPGDRVIVIGPWRILLTHGHSYGVKLTHAPLIAEARKQEAQIVLFGHNHEPEVTMEGGVCLINPGSTALPRGMSGPTCAVLKLTPEKFLPQIINLRQGVTHKT